MRESLLTTETDKKGRIAISISLMGKLRLRFSDLPVVAQCVSDRAGDHTLISRFPDRLSFAVAPRFRHIALIVVQRLSINVYVLCTTELPYDADSYML